MLQRNTSGYPLHLPTLEPPVRVEPGEDFDHPDRLAGFTPVDELDTPTTEDPDTDEDGDDSDTQPPAEPAPDDDEDEED